MSQREWGKRSRLNCFRQTGRSTKLATALLKEYAAIEPSERILSINVQRRHVLLSEEGTPGILPNDPVVTQAMSNLKRSNGTLRELPVFAIVLERPAQSGEAALNRFDVRATTANPEAAARIRWCTSGCGRSSAARKRCR